MGGRRGDEIYSQTAKKKARRPFPAAGVVPREGILYILEGIVKYISRLYIYIYILQI